MNWGELGTKKFNLALSAGRALLETLVHAVDWYLPFVRVNAMAITTMLGDKILMIILTIVKSNVLYDRTLRWVLIVRRVFLYYRKC